jgi:hypothetical protein
MAEAFNNKRDTLSDDELDDFVKLTKLHLESIEDACRHIRSHLENHFEL